MRFAARGSGFWLAATLALGLGLCTVSANAAPVAREADIALSLQIGFLPGISISATGATVTVDSTAGTLSIGAGQLVQTAPITIPVTASTAIASIKATGLDNLTGVFSLGGGAVTSPASELPCATAVPVGIGCVTAGAGNLGGQMALSGTMFIIDVPRIVTIPHPLSAAGIGRGGFARIPNTPAGILYDAAPFTTGIAKVGYTGTSKTTWMGVFNSNPLTVTYTMSWVTVGSSTGANEGTGASGTITLVSPTYLKILGNAMPLFSTLEIHFIPEPGTTLLLMTGLLGLASVLRRHPSGRHRR